MSDVMKTLSSACAEREEDLVLLYYGDLAGTEHDTLQDHLHGCANCRRFLQDLGKLLPLTRKVDNPEQDFWADYHRELRHKLDEAAGPPLWRQRLVAWIQWRPVPVFATAAVVALALTLSLGREFRRADDPARDHAALVEVLPIAEDLEFFRAMDVLDDLDLLEAMGSPGGAA